MLSCPCSVKYSNCAGPSTKISRSPDRNSMDAATRATSAGLASDTANTADASRSTGTDTDVPFSSLSCNGPDVSRPATTCPSTNATCTCGSLGSIRPRPITRSAGSVIVP